MPAGFLPRKSPITHPIFLKAAEREIMTKRVIWKAKALVYKVWEVSGMDSVHMHDDVRDAVIERMMGQYGAAVYRMCFVYLREKTLAEDAGQETFLKAYRSLDTFAGGHAQSEKAWLMRIAINTCKDVLRTRWYRARLRGIPLDQIPEPAMEPDRADRDLVEAILRLPLRLKEVVLLHYYQEMTYDEITQALGISRTAVYQRLTKAKKLLKGSLEGWVGDEQSQH